MKPHDKYTYCIYNTLKLSTVVILDTRIIMTKKENEKSGPKRNKSKKGRMEKE